MIRVLLTLSLLMSAPAFAQEATNFDPVPASVEGEDGLTLHGILISEEDYIELGELRVQVATLENEVAALEEAQAAKEDIWLMTEEALRVRHEEDLQGLRGFYSLELERASKRTAMEKHGFGIGVGVGIIGTVAAVVVTGYALGQVSQ